MMQLIILVFFTSLWFVYCLFCFAILLFVDNGFKMLLQHLIPKKKEVK